MPWSLPRASSSRARAGPGVRLRPAAGLAWAGRRREAVLLIRGVAVWRQRPLDHRAKNCRGFDWAIRTQARRKGRGQIYFRENARVSLLLQSGPDAVPPASPEVAEHAAIASPASLKQALRMVPRLGPAQRRGRRSPRREPPRGALLGSGPARAPPHLRWTLAARSGRPHRSAFARLIARSSERGAALLQPRDGQTP